MLTLWLGAPHSNPPRCASSSLSSNLAPPYTSRLGPRANCASAQRHRTTPITSATTAPPACGPPSAMVRTDITIQNTPNPPPKRKALHLASSQSNIALPHQVRVRVEFADQVLLALVV